MQRHTEKLHRCYNLQAAINSILLRCPSNISASFTRKHTVPFAISHRYPHSQYAIDAVFKVCLTMFAKSFKTSEANRPYELKFSHKSFVIFDIFI